MTDDYVFEGDRRSAPRYGLALCRAWIMGRKIGHRQIHLCGRQEYHGGQHKCYCGWSWHKSKGSKVCKAWRPESFTALRDAQPGSKITEAQVLELYGKRKFDI